MGVGDRIKTIICERKTINNMRISKKDYGTAAKIVAAKAIEMHKKGANWRRGNQFLTCVDIGKIADKLFSFLNQNQSFHIRGIKSRR